jgi:hypothetical protein
MVIEWNWFQHDILIRNSSSARGRLHRTNCHSVPNFSLLGKPLDPGKLISSRTVYRRLPYCQVERGWCINQVVLNMTSQRHFAIESIRKNS